MAKKTDFKDLSLEELKAKARELEQETFELRNELALNRKLEKPHLIKAKKKDRARVLTFMTQKQVVVA